MLNMRTALIAITLCLAACDTSDHSPPDVAVAAGENFLLAGELGVFQVVAVDEPNERLHVAALNLSDIECTPGVVLPACKVAIVDFSSIPDAIPDAGDLTALFAGQRAFIEGWIDVTDGGENRVETLFALEVWLAHDEDGVMATTVYTVTQGSDGCEAERCGSFRAELTNTEDPQILHELDFEGSSVSNAQIDTAKEAVTNGEEILVVGTMANQTLSVQRLFLPASY